MAKKKSTTKKTTSAPSQIDATREYIDSFQRLIPKNFISPTPPAPSVSSTPVDVIPLRGEDSIAAGKTYPSIDTSTKRDGDSRGALGTYPSVSASTMGATERGEYRASTGGTGGTGTAATSTVSMEQQDAFAMIKELFTNYGLEDLIPAINELMISGVGPAAASLAIKTEKKYNEDPITKQPIGYKKRFYGNELRREQGLNVLSEAEYLALEDSYSETLTSYGLINYFGPKGSERTRRMAEVIGANISAVEFNDRVQTAYSRVQNTDANTRNAFKTIYGITDADLTRYFLNPAENVNVLKEKVSTAEIYGSAVAQGLSGSVEVSTQLAKLGVDKQLARQGYSIVADVLPEATKLGQIYNEISGYKPEDKLSGYTQAMAEQEVFQGLASARRARERLVEREMAEFGGESGLSKASLTRETGGRI